MWISKTPACRAGALVLTLALTLILTPASAAEEPVEAYWQALQALCGQAYAGELLAASDDSFAGKALRMHVRHCRDDEIRIPFVVGENRSRTWILRRVGNRILLKHDHRHADGRPEEITMYGGTSTNPGTASEQLFPADEQTVQLVPAAYANVWTIGIDPGQRFTYRLQRLGTERKFVIEFDLSRPVDAPPAPWGWRD